MPGQGRALVPAGCCELGKLEMSSIRIVYCLRKGSEISKLDR